MNTYSLYFINLSNHFVVVTKSSKVVLLPLPSGGKDL